MDGLANSWAQVAWAHSWQVTLLIALVGLVLRLVGQNRPHLACALWLVVLLKCITPPILSSPSGIFCWLQPEELRVASSDVSAPHRQLAAADGDDVVVHMARPLPNPLPGAAKLSDAPRPASHSPPQQLPT